MKISALRRSWETLEEPKRLRRLAHLCREKIYAIERALVLQHVEVLSEKRHLQQGSSERKYWSAGYLQALKDVKELLESGTFPSRSEELETDGGPRPRLSILPLPEVSDDCP